MSFEAVIRALTVPLNGQLPRPWMTDSPDPTKADVFIVGYNPAKTYRADAVTQIRHIDALFNRNGESCRGLYAELTRESPTRGNIEALTELLVAAGVGSVLETNVICYSTAKKAHLTLPQNSGGKERGRAIFKTLLHEIKPKAIIVHGVGVQEEFNRLHAVEGQLPRPPASSGQFARCTLRSGAVAFSIPSLAMPGYQNWPPGNSFCNWAAPYLAELAGKVAEVVRR